MRSQEAIAAFKTVVHKYGSISGYKISVSPQPPHSTEASLTIHSNSPKYPTNLKMKQQ
jgi:hypothetical protein